MSLPTLTLVTPSFNQAGFLERTIASVLEQGYPRLEWIVVDAMSTDGTAEILGKYRDVPFLHVIREPDKGQTDAINKGLRSGSGDVAGWLNSDDELLPGALHAIGAAFREHPEAAMIYGGGRKVADDGALLKTVPSRSFDPRLLKTAFYILQPSMFFHRTLALDLGGLDTALHYAMDWELALRLADVGPVYRIARELSALRCYSGTKTETGGWERFEEIARIARRRHGLLDRNVLAWHARRLAAGSAFARRVVDGVFSRLFPERSVMVTGWPAGKPKK